MAVRNGSCLDAVFFNCFSRLVAVCRNLDLVSADLCAADGAVNNALIGTCLGAGRLDAVFFNCFSRLVAGCRDLDLVSADLCAADGAVNDALIGTCFGAGRLDAVFLDSLCWRMTERICSLDLNGITARLTVVVCSIDRGAHCRAGRLVCHSLDLISQNRFRLTATIVQAAECHGCALVIACKLDTFKLIRMLIRRQRQSLRIHIAKNQRGNRILPCSSKSSGAGGMAGRFRIIHIGNRCLGQLLLLFKCVRIDTLDIHRTGVFQFTFNLCPVPLFSGPLVLVLLRLQIRIIFALQVSLDFVLIGAVIILKQNLKKILD